MPRRKMRSPRFPTLNYGHFGEGVMTHRSVVAPGETLKELRAKFRLQSLPTRYSLTGATVDFWWFYVPARVAWSEFPEWLMGQVPEGDLPTTDDEFGSSFYFNPDHGSSTDKQHSLVSRAYTAIINHYFRTDEDGTYDPAVDGHVARLPIVDMTAELLGSLDGFDADATVDTSSGSFDISDLEQAEAERAYELKRAHLDGRYTTYLNRMGVRVQEQVLDVPEMIGHSRKFIFPSRAIDETTGMTVQSFFHDVAVKLQKPRYFMEHGFLIGLMSLRPKVILKGGYAWDAWLVKPEHWPVPDQLDAHKEDIAFQSVTQLGNARWYFDMALLRGQHLANNLASISTDMVLGYDPSDLQSARIPTQAYDSMVDTTTYAELGGRHFVLDGVTGTRIATPLRLGQVPA